VTASDDVARRGFGYKPGLDGLRAVAVGSVIAFHFGAGWAPGGFLGVDLFFVLSGYLITSLLVIEWDRTSTIRFAAFWARRARRLLPALFLVLIAIAIWAAAVAHRDELASIRSDSIWTLFYAANWRFISSGQSYFAMFRDASPLRHAWSLAIEEQFYLVWPLVTFVCLRVGRGRRWLLAIGSVLGIVAASVLMSRWYDSADPSRAYYGTDTRAGQLLVGALLAIVLLRWSPRTARTRAALQVVGLVAAGVCVWMFANVADSEAFLYRGGLLLFAVSTAIVIAAVVQPTRSPLVALLAVRPVRWVGAISYGLYLWHWPIAVAVTEGRTGLSGWALAAARTGLTLGCATLSYYCLEVPIRRGVWLRRRAAFVIAPAAGLATAVAIVVGTSGGTSPPRFLVARPNAVVRSQPVTVPTVPVQASEAELGVSRMLLLGDSVADTLGDALQVEAAAHGVSVSSITRPGCGMTTETPLRADGSPVPWGEACATFTAQYQSDAVNEAAPNVVLWLSTWETSDALANGVKVDFGTRAGDDALLAELDAARSRLTAQGARLVLITLPAPADSSEVMPLRPDEGLRRNHLNSVFRRFAVRYPGTVGVADLAAIVCPPGGTSCPATVDGLVLRPRDGNHFEGDGPAWVAPRLYAAIIRATAGMTSAQAIEALPLAIAR
jgi:peptidoglycan/LPS O-acetylase OafA/YrhL